MSNFVTLSSQIVAKVVANSNFDSGAVFDYEPEIDGITQDPFATVIPSGNASDYGSTSENRRTYAFKVRIFIERNTRGNSAADTLLRTIIDALINAFDQDITLGGNALMVLAAPSEWGYVQGAKEYRTAEINIQAKVWFDTTA